MPSRTIRPTQAPTPAPFAYTVAAEGFTPDAVFASWDGGSAAVDFLPCVSYYSADGVLLDRAFPTTGPVTAGDVADVSYRPFERGGAAATPPFVLSVGDTQHFFSPVTQIFAPDPLAVSDLGGGEVRVQYQPAYARGTCNNGLPVNVVTPQTLPLTTLASRNVTVTATTWRILLAGTYLIGLTAQFTRIGPLAAGTNMSVGLQNTSAANQAIIIDLPAPAIPSGETFSLSTGVSRMIPCAVGDTLSLVASSNIGSTTFTVAVAVPYLMYLFP